MGKNGLVLHHIDAPNRQAMNASMPKAAPVLGVPVGAPNAARQGGKRGSRDLTIALAGLVYLGMVLFADWSSPLLGIMLIAFAGYELFARRGGKDQESD